MIHYASKIGNYNRKNEMYIFSKRNVHFFVIFPRY